MMKRNKLYTLNRYNGPALVDRINHNIFDGYQSSVIIGGYNPNSYYDSYYGKAKSTAPNTNITAKVQQPTVMQQIAQNKSNGNTNVGVTAGGTSFTQTPVYIQQTAQGVTDNNPNGVLKIDTSGIPKNMDTKLGDKVGWQQNGYLATAMNIAGQVKVNDKDRRGLFDTLDPFHNIAGKKADSTAVGKTLGDIGAAAASTGIPYAMLAGAALKVIGDIADNGWGYSIENEEAVKNNIAGLRNVNFNAADFDTLQDQFDQAGIRKVGLGEVDNGLFTDRGTEKAEELNRQQNEAYEYALNSFKNAGYNIDKGFYEDYMRNYSAFGGPLDMPNEVSAVNYGFMTDYLTEKKRQNDLKNKMTGMTQMPSFMPSYALGGDLQANGSDWTTGLTHVEAGGTHEENPYEGVQMGVDREGVPNLVEEDETVYNDYVYSNRIKCDPTTKEKFHVSKKRDITFADLSKKLEKEIAERPNDPISQAAFKAQMADLAEQQERQKQEMEAARAREAFEALSPEEQTALIQQYAQQEQMAKQQAMQEQAMAEQAAAEQQPTPEEIAMAEQQQMMQADGSQAALGQAPQMACGGKINRFDEGGMKKKIYDLLGLKTQSDWNAWVKKNGLDEMNDVDDWDNILQNQALINAIAKDNPALRHALENKYDFGLYKPSASGSVTFDDDRGNWDAQTVQGWWGSTDPAWQEVIKNNPNLTKDTKLSKEELADLIRNTDAFKKGTQWLQDSEDNRLNYLKRIINNPAAPERAVAYARKYIDENGWKEGAARDYETIFNNPSGRAANPGTYWKTPIEAVRNSLANNYVINEDGTVEALEGNVDGLTLDSTYQWADPQTDYTNNYYRRAAAQAAGNDAAKAAGDTAATAATGDDREVVPVHSKLENLRMAGLLAPAAGLVMQGLNIGRPDTSGIEAAVNIGKSPAYLASPHLIGDYMAPKYWDRLFYANQIQANARATDRSLMNNAGANRGTAMAGLLANGYNTNIALGKADREGEEFNWNTLKDVKGFNRGTNQFNADVLNRTSQFNADALNRGKQYNAQLAMQAAQAKMDADAGWYNGIYGNVAGLFKGLGDLGREKAQENRIADMAATGIFGRMRPGSYIANGMLRYETDEERAKRLANQKVKTAKGGKINRKKGFTY